MLKCFFRDSPSSHYSDPSHTSKAITLSHDTTVSLASGFLLISLCPFFLFVHPVSSPFPYSLGLHSPRHINPSKLSLLRFIHIFYLICYLHVLSLSQSNCQGLPFKLMRFFFLSSPAFLFLHRFLFLNVLFFHVLPLSPFYISLISFNA